MWFKALLASSLFLFYADIAKAADVVPIGFYNTTPKHVQRELLYSIFTLKITSWSDGTRIKVFILPRDNNSSREFIYSYLNVSPNHYYDVINASSSSGKTNSAYVVESEVDLINKVAITPGAIGFGSRTIIINIGDAGVKVINVY